ncbi:MAG: protein kinase family protein [Phycisphaerales bacterium]|nr:protein kinase family protein [Phycisphaerales bacterium]
MLELLESTHVGPYLLTRELEPCAIAERHLALHQTDHSSHVAYRFGIPARSAARRRLESAVAACRALPHDHLLAIEDVVETDEDLWVICPFTGDVDGVRTIGKLLREKRGQMEPFEAARALEQVLETISFVHPKLIHGAVAMDEILVDRHGCLLLEFYGLRRDWRKGPLTTEAEDMRDEVRSVVEIGYQLITGLRAEEPMIPAGRLVRDLDPALDRWLSKGLCPTGGFATAAQALAELPSRLAGAHAEAEEQPRWSAWNSLGNVRSLLGRLRATRG